MIASKAEIKALAFSNTFDINAVKDNLTKDVTILVNESGIASAKTKKAETMGITIINNIKDILEEN